MLNALSLLPTARPLSASTRVLSLAAQGSAFLAAEGSALASVLALSVGLSAALLSAVLSAPPSTFFAGSQAGKASVAASNRVILFIISTPSPTLPAFSDNRHCERDAAWV